MQLLNRQHCPNRADTVMRFLASRIGRRSMTVALERSAHCELVKGAWAKTDRSFSRWAFSLASQPALRCQVTLRTIEDRLARDRVAQIYQASLLDATLA